MIEQLPPDPGAVALVRVPGAVLSHESAARLLGIELVEDDGTRRLTVPRNRSRVALPGWEVRRQALDRDDLLRRDDGLVLTSAGRTIADLATVLPLPHAVASADSALRRRLVTAAALAEVLLRGPAPGSARRRAAAGLVDGRSGSVLESLLRVLLFTSGLPHPVVQHEIRADGVLLARVDFCWPERLLVAEADGFAFHSDRAAYRRDRQRTNQLVSRGWRVLRFSWEDVVHRPAYVVALVAECLRRAA